MIPQGLALIKQPSRRTRSARRSPIRPDHGVSAVAGPVVAGVLLDADLWGTGWRMIFFINLPLGVAAVLGAIKYMPKLCGPTSRRDASTRSARCCSRRHRSR